MKFEQDFFFLESMSSWCIFLNNYACAQLTIIIFLFHGGKGFHAQIVKTSFENGIYLFIYLHVHKVIFSFHRFIYLFNFLQGLCNTPAMEPAGNAEQ